MKAHPSYGVEEDVISAIACYHNQSSRGLYGGTWTEDLGSRVRESKVVQEDQASTEQISRILYQLRWNTHKTRAGTKTK